MARITQRLTAVTVTNLKAKGLHSDGDGLYLRITATGTKSWIFRFAQSGTTRDMGLGPLSSVSLARARELAAEARRQRLDGDDPIAERDALRASQRLARTRSKTFRQAATEYIATHRAGWRNAKHAGQWTRTLETYAFPVIGDLGVADISTQDVLDVLRPLWLGDKHNAPRPETAARVRGRIEAIIDAARADDDAQRANPARWKGHLQHKLPKRSKVQAVRHYSALPYRDLPAFMARLRAREGITPRALELTILTAVRTGEAIGARFDEFDLATKVWRIPAERMKAHQEHRVPLSDRAIAIVKEMASTRLSDFVFPGSKRGQPLSNMAMLMLLRELHAGITTHGFRSSFRDWAGEETSHPHDICEAALAHTRRDKAHAAYQRGDLLQKRRKLMEGWASHCERKSVSADVLPLKRREKRNGP